MNYKDVIAYEERRMAGKNKAYIVFAYERSTVFGQHYYDDDKKNCPPPTAVFATTTLKKAEQYVKEHNADATYNHFIDVVPFEA